MRGGLGRRQAPDARDARYPARALLPAVASTRRRRYWNESGWWGDQGASSECVAYAWTHWLEDGPVTHAGAAPVVPPDALYAEAQKADEWPGEDYEGTSVRAGAKVLQARGWISAYHWAGGLGDVVAALLEVGPVVVGVNWYEAMFDPDPAGQVHVEGPLAGGHAFVLNGVNLDTRLVRFKNSWGHGWGVNGHAFLGFEDLTRLLAEDGEACLAVEVKR